MLICCSARSTSAAPIYFRPYYHRRTRRTYIDGAIQRNNPIRVADEERRLIWRDNKNPDIILSVGTGMQVNFSGGAKSARSSKMGLVQKMIPKGVRTKIATGYDMVLSTLD